MKTAISVLLLSALARLSGCESMGWNGHFMRDTLTPNVSSETTVRTWNNGVPTETPAP